MAETPGQRAFKVRLALGDGVKNPMTLKDLAALIRRTCKVSYDPSALSRLENGSRDMTLEDARVLAAVDPRARGRAWVAWGDEKAPTEAGAEDFTVGAVALTAAQKARAVEAAAATERTRKAAESARPKRRRSNEGP